MYVYIYILWIIYQNIEMRNCGACNACNTNWGRDQHTAEISRVWGSAALGHGRITAQVHVAQRRELPCEQPQSHATSMRSPNEGKLMGMGVPSLDSWKFHGQNHGCIDLWNIYGGYGGYVELVIVGSSTYLGGVTWKGSDHMSGGWISPKTTEGLITRLKMTLQMGDVQIKSKIEPWKIWYTYYPLVN
jgi:hypothetical protein